MNIQYLFSKSTFYLVLFVGFIFALITTIIIGEIIFYLEQKNYQNTVEAFSFQDSNFEDFFSILLKNNESCSEEKLSGIFRLLHNEDKSYADTFALIADFICISKNVEIAQTYYDLEHKYHKENQLHFYKCVKNCLGTTKKAFTFLKLAKTSKLEKGKLSMAKAKLLNFSPFRNMMELKNKNIVFLTTVNYFIAGKQIFLYLIDLIKDLFLIITIARFVSLSASSWDTFSCQVFLILLLSLVLSECAKLVSFWSNNESILYKTWPNAKIFLASMTPILSSVTLYISTKYKSLRLSEKIKVKKHSGFLSTFQIMRERLKYLETQENNWCDISAIMRNNENVFEHTLQVIVLLIFTALIFTHTQTVDGLQQLYADENKEWIILSALFSMRSITVGFQGWIENQKRSTLSTSGKLFLELYALLSILCRLSAILLFFAPSLGLLNILMHWKMGAIPGIYNIVEHFSKLADPRKSKFYVYFRAGYHELGELPNLETINDLLTDSVNFNPEWKGIDSYQNLTVFSLQTYYICFLIGIIFHFIVVYTIKHFFGLGFSRQSSVKVLDKVLNVIDQLVIPSTFKDWDDEDEDENEDFKEIWKKVSREMKSLLLLFSIENILLLIPLFILMQSIKV